MQTLKSYWGRQTPGFVDAIEAPKTTPVSIARLCRIFRLFFRQPFSQRDEFFTLRPVFAI